MDIHNELLMADSWKQLFICSSYTAKIILIYGLERGESMYVSWRDKKIIWHVIQVDCCVLGPCRWVVYAIGM